MLVAIHQPNFIPWFPFFEKMNLADCFVILTQCQFSKGGWQNRCKIHDTYWTNPVEHGLEPIALKSYTDGTNLLDLNMSWIRPIRRTLGIETPIMFDYESGTERSGSERLVDIIRYYGGDRYLTNPDAFDKYLDRQVFEDNNIEIVPFETKHPIHTFEMFHNHGIEGTREILNRSKKEFDAKHNSILCSHE